MCLNIPFVFMFAVTQLPDCNETQFLCGSGGCVNYSLVCDGKADCADSSDEDSRFAACKYMAFGGLTLWGLGTWNFISPRTEHFLAIFLFYLLNQSFIGHGSQFASLFSIGQEHMSL